MRVSRNPYFNPPVEVRPVSVVPTPAQLLKQYPNISEDHFFSYHDTHEALMDEMKHYDTSPSARRGFWNLERRLQRLWNHIDPPPAYQRTFLPPYKP